MKSVICTGYGSANVLEIHEIDKPIPKINEVLVKIAATAVNSADIRIRKADPWLIRLIYGLGKPGKQILGVVMSGEVVEIGSNVTKFKVGDKVFGLIDKNMGGYAEYIAIEENESIALSPSSIPLNEAATIPFGAHTALYFLRKANIKSGQKVLIYGASGAVGTAAVQLAKYYGANVTAVCSGENIALMKSLKADNIIDYTKLLSH